MKASWIACFGMAAVVGFSIPLPTFSPAYPFLRDLSVSREHPVAPAPGCPSMEDDFFITLDPSASSEDESGQQSLALTISPTFRSENAIEAGQIAAVLATDRGDIKHVYEPADIDVAAFADSRTSIVIPSLPDGYYTLRVTAVVASPAQMHSDVTTKGFVVAGGQIELPEPEEWDAQTAAARAHDEADMATLPDDTTPNLEVLIGDAS